MGPKTHPDKNLDEDTTEIFKAVDNAKEEGLVSRDFKVLYQKNEYIKFHTEVNQESLPDILEEEENDILAQSEKLFSDWKRFYIQKACLLALMALGYKVCKHIADPKNDSRIKKNTFVQKMVARYNTIKKKYGKEKIKYIKRGAQVAFFTIFGLYPLYRFRKLRQLASITDTYHSQDLKHNGHNFRNLQWFYRRTYSHSRTIGNTTTTYYNISAPLGYMNAEDRRTEFMPIRKAKSMRALTWLSTLTDLLIACLI